MTRTPEEIADRLAAVAHIGIEDQTRGSKHYGYVLSVGNSELKSIWHCTDDRTHPEDAEYRRQGWDVGDLYCDSHYPTVDDDAALTFLVNAREDIQALLALVGINIPLLDKE